MRVVTIQGPMFSALSSLFQLTTPLAPKKNATSPLSLRPKYITGNVDRALKGRYAIGEEGGSARRPTA